MERSVERVDGVSRVAVDLDSGRASVEFETDKTASPAGLWDAVKESGFTPIWVKTGDQVYNGPEPEN